jgi:mannose-6-phosphate isomerase-like protein (cupin superfamily)
MFVSPLLIIFAAFACVLAVDITVNPALDASLFTAATQLDRLKLLSSDKDWVFDFTAQPSYTYSPGSVVNANAATFPAMVRNGMTLAMLNLGPCAMLPPHYHPRATNEVVAISGTTNTYMIEENGARMVSETLTPGKMTLFPQGSLHSMQNTGELSIPRQLFRQFEISFRKVVSQSLRKFERLTLSCSPTHSLNAFTFDNTHC